jgi:hypothetical protein
MARGSYSMPKGMTTRSKKRTKALPPGMARRRAAYDRYVQRATSRIDPQVKPQSVSATKKRHRGM